MAKRKTQIDKAIEQLQQELDALTRTYETRRAAQESAIDALRAQQITRPRKARTSKPAPPVGS